MQPEIVALRPATAADRPAIVDLINRDSLATLGTRRALLDDAGNVRLARSMPGVIEQRVAVAPAGTLAGWACASGPEPGLVWLAAGFSHCRTWIHLDLTLAAPPPPPQALPGVTIRRMDQRHDWPAAGAALEHAFGDHWGELPPPPALPGLFAADPAADPEAPPEDDDPYFNTHDLCFVAISDGAIIGSCLGMRTFRRELVFEQELRPGQELRVMG